MTMTSERILKVLHVTRSEELGIRTFLLGLLSNNDPSRFSLALAGPLTGPLTADLPQLGVTPWYCPLERDVRLAGDIRAFFSLWNLVRREKPDVLHLHGAKAGFLGRIVGFLRGIRAVVYTPNNNYLDAPMPGWRRRILILLEKAAARLGGQIVSVSVAERESWLERRIARPEQLSLIYDGFDFSHASQIIPRGEAMCKLGLAPRRAISRGVVNEGLSNDQQVVGLIARLVPQKAAHIFLQAAALVLRQRPNVCFLVVGDGLLRGDLEQLARDLGIFRDVIFAGFLPDLSPVYSVLDISVLTSLYEGLPMVVLESMYLKIPLVSSCTQGAAEVLNAECGVVTPINDPAATAEGILSLLCDPARGRQLAENAHARVVADLGADRMAAEYQALYLRLVASRGVHREEANRRQKKTERSSSLDRASVGKTLSEILRTFIDMNRKACARWASYLPHTQARIFAAYEETAGQCASARPRQLVVDVGGGAQCVFLHRCTVQPRIVTLDISREELNRNRNVQAKVVADASRALPFADASVDVVLSSCVVEHLPDVDAFLAEASRILKPGGASIHMFPSKYAPFVFANRALPHSLARRLLYFFHPSQKGFAGFRAYYDHCSPAQFKSLLGKHGLALQQLRLSYFQSDYVNFFLPLFLLSAAYEAVISALGLKSLCAFVLCVAVKSPTEQFCTSGLVDALWR